MIVLYILLAVMALLVMVTVHEFGHYISGKLLGFQINEFSIGFGPKIFSKTRDNGEVFSLRAIPLGGFCAFEGEDEDGNESPNAFNNQKPWKRIIVLFSGAFMNFISALLLAILVFLIGGMSMPTVHEILPDAGSENGVVQTEYVLQEGDILLSINGHFIYPTTSLSSILSEIENGEIVTARIVRDGKEMEVQVQKREYQSTVEDEAGNVTVQKAWGFGIMQSYTAYHLGFFESIGRSVSYCLRMGWVILGTVGQLFTGQLGLDAVGGPLTTIGMTAEVARSGFRYFLDIVVMIDVNLAVMNLLPIPALDGCRIIFTAIEWIRRKPVNRKVEAIVHTVGLLLLFGFVILADINQLFFL